MYYFLISLSVGFIVNAGTGTEIVLFNKIKIKSSALM